MSNSKTMLIRCALIAAAVLPAARPVGAASSSGSSTETDQLAGTYVAFAGSDANALALVTGLRTGTSITLTSAGGATTTFTPATRPMGFGSVNIALALARTDLEQQGIANPTPEQIEAALNGGTITTSTGMTTLPGILRLRSEGEGWGVIANSMGVRLGEIVSATKTDRPMAHGAFAKPEKVEKPERVERPVRPERIERPGR